MHAPETLSDALEALASARADLSALDALSAEHKTALAASAELSESLAALKVSYDALTAENASLLAQLGELKAREADANAKAVDIVAALGVAPVTVAIEPQAAAPKTLSERLAGVTDPMARAKIRQEFLNSLK